MIRRIELTNFMSHRHTVIEPANGLTVLVGPNNCGKSAVASALQILCENVRGDYMVRHGEDECRILVETDDGHTIEWRRIKGTQSYRLNDEDVHRLQGGVPDSLHALLRLPKVRSSDEGYEFDIHFGNQKDPIFLVNQPGSRAATFFASSSDASHLVEMQQLHRSKGQQARRDETRLAKEVADLEAQIDYLKPALALEKKAEEAQKDRQAIIELTERLKAQSQIQKDIRDRIETLEALEAEVTALRPLTAPPKLTDTSAIEQIIDQIGDVQRRQARETARSTALEPLADAPQLRPIEPLVNLIEDLTRLESWQVTLEAANHAAEPLAPPPKLADTKPLETVIAQLDAAANAVHRIQIPAEVLVHIAAPPELADVDSMAALVNWLLDAVDHVQGLELTCGLLSDLAEPPTPADESRLGDTIKGLKDLESEVKGLETQSNRAARELAKVEKALRDWASGSGLCPTCGAELDPDRVVEMAKAGLGRHNHG
ncbi:MAG: AAA family ATPase [Phycisphaerae bacterium]